MNTLNTCAVSDRNCLAPANNTTESCGQTRCYVCGGSVCTKCSNLVTWYHKRVRACTNCVPEEES